ISSPVLHFQESPPITDSLEESPSQIERLPRIYGALGYCTFTEERLLQLYVFVCVTEYLPSLATVIDGLCDPVDHFTSVMPSGTLVIRSNSFPSHIYTKSGWFITGLAGIGFVITSISA